MPRSPWRYTTHWPVIAERLGRTFLARAAHVGIAKKEDLIVDEVTAGRPTVGLRVPNHPMALELLRAFDGPLAAPSANRANHISPHAR